MMKRKDRINRARLHKLARLGIGLVAFTALGGGISPVGDYLFSNPSVVYAETYVNISDQPIVVVVHYHGQNLDGTTVSLTEQGEFIEFQPGQEIAAPREFEGYTLTETSYIPPAFSEGLLMYSYTQDETPKQPESTEKPVETPAEKQITSSEISFLNLDERTYWRGAWGDEAIVGTANIEYEVGGDLTIPATIVPEGYEVIDVRFNILGMGVKELPHTWTYEEYKKHLTPPPFAREIDILVKPVSSPANPTTPPAETPTEQPPQPITFPVRYVSVDYTADKGVVITGVLYETTATVEPGGTVFIENKTFDGYSLDTMEGPWKTEYSYEDVVAAGWSDGIDLRYAAKTPPAETPPAETPTVDTPVTPPAETPVVTAKVTAFKLEELVGANYKYQPMGTFSLEPVVIQLQPGETYTPPSYDGYKLVKFENSNSVTDITPEESTVSYADFTPGQEISLDYYYLNTKQVYDVVNKRYVDRDTNLSPLPPTETPTVDTPASPPTETPTVDTPITPPIETPTVDTPVTPATETPTVDTPVTPPTETPSVEVPVTPPADSNPTETSPVTNQSTQNQPAQTGDLSSQADKKPVSQTAQEQPQAKQASVKPQQETTQGAKSLPATGEAGSILGLAGLGFTGLSGLHYALRPRKRQRSARK